MNINKAIKDLLTEKERLDRAIAHLEGMQRQRGTTDGAAAPKRRGRRTMDAKARREVSERMRRYWAMRRKETVEKPAPPPAAN